MYLCKTIEFYDIQESYSVMKWSKTQNLSESQFFLVHPVDDLWKLPLSIKVLNLDEENDMIGGRLPKRSSSTVLCIWFQ